jgi:hypothetical protein
MDNNLAHKTRTFSDLGTWNEGPWIQRETDTGSYEVVHQKTGTVLATLPDYAAPIAEWMCAARDALPALLADNAALAQRNKALLSSSKQLMRQPKGPNQ